MANEIICIGDSITGWNITSQNKSSWQIPVYPEYLEEMLKKDKVENLVVNAGFDGARSNESLSILEEYNLRYPKSKYIIMEFGTNDFYDTGFNHQTSNKIRSYIAGTVKLINYLKKVPIILNQHKVSEKTEDIARIEKHNQYLKSECISHSAHYVDIYSKIKPKHLEDGVHPNESGAKIIANEVYSVLKKIL